MIKKWSFILMVVLLAGACSKNKSCPAVTYQAPASEVANLKAYLQANNITATEDSRGFFYTITKAGSTAKPNVCSNVTVSYEGKLASTGATFDSSPGVQFNLGDLILGWQEGIPLIGSGGNITLYLPPSLAYGANGSGSAIPPNSNLIFEIGLKAF